MNHIAVMMLIAIGFVPPSVAEQADTSEAKFLTIGDVSKIDTKDKSITINYATSYDISQFGNVGNDTGGRGSRTAGTGGAAVRGGGRGGRRGGGGGAAPSGRAASAPLPKEYKVVISSKTVIKEGDNEIKIDDLKVGDRLQVFSMKGGSKLNALEIIRTPKDNS